MGIDAGLRYFIVSDGVSDISGFFLWLGSDDALDFEVGWVLGSFMTFIESLIFIIVMLTLETDTLHAMRSRGTAEHISIIMLFAFLAKTVLYIYIGGMPLPVDDSSVDKTEVKSEIHNNTNAV